MQKAGVSRPKTGPRIKRRKGGFIVNMDPLAVSFSRSGDRSFNECQPDATTAILGINGRIEQERVCAAIGRDVDESDESGAIEGGDEGSAALQDWSERVLGMMGPAAPKQCVQRAVMKRRIGGVGNATHGGIVCIRLTNSRLNFVS
jgi:hypothetical protein